MMPSDIDGPHIQRIPLSRRCPECDGEGEVERDITEYGCAPTDALVFCGWCDGTGINQEEE